MYKRHMFLSGSSQSVSTRHPTREKACCMATTTCNTTSLTQCLDTTWGTSTETSTRGLPTRSHFTPYGLMGSCMRYSIRPYGIRGCDTDENDARCTHQMSHKYGQQQTRDIISCRPRGREESGTSAATLRRRQRWSSCRALGRAAAWGRGWCGSSRGGEAAAEASRDARALAHGLSHLGLLLVGARARSRATVERELATHTHLPPSPSFPFLPLACPL